MTETLHAGQPLENNGCTNVVAVPGAPDGTWTGNAGDNVSWNARWTITDPVDPLASGQTHTVQVLARKSAAGGNGDPSATVELWDGGVLVSTLVASTALTDASTPNGTVLEGTFGTAEVSSGADIQIRVAATAQGGSPAGRRNVQIDAITVLVETAIASTPVDLIDRPTALRLSGPVLTVVRSTTLIDRPQGLRLGGSPVAVTAGTAATAVDIADRPTALRLANPATTWQHIITMATVRTADRLKIQRRHGVKPWWTGGPP